MDEIETKVQPDSWYRWGKVVLYAEMGIAVFTTIFSLYLAFTGQGGFFA